MSKFRTLFAISVVIFAQQVMADSSNMMSMQSTATDDSCKAIVKACLSAGYKRTDVTGKKFWFDCMKPVLMGQTVKKIKIDADMIQKCRAQKIDEMKKEIDDLQNVQSN